MITDAVRSAMIQRVLEHEGGYANHPTDPGGETMYGITVATARRHGYRGKMRDLPLATAVAIFRDDYWHAVRGDALPPAVAFQAFDACVNSGPGNAIRWLQRAAGVADDGIIGPRTLAAVAAAPAYAVVLAMNAERLSFLTMLSTWGKFGAGWSRRIAGNLRYAVEDLA